MMMITYCWELESVEREYKTISSRLISFHGERVFRVGLKNRDKPTLIFMNINLKNIGLRVREVGFCTKDPQSRQKMKHNDVDGHSLQLFTFDLSAMVVGNCTFTFSIWLEGGAPGCYSYQLCDRLSKEELWNTSNNEHLIDVEILCKDNKKFSAHKAILAARSPVFLTKFKSEPLQPKNAPLKQITIDDVDSSTVEQFLYFLYTGELKIPMLVNEELLKLALRYQLTTLIELCQIGVHEIDVMQMASFVSNLELDQTELPSTISIR
jgi:speckle-type POZ protein